MCACVCVCVCLAEFTRSLHVYGLEKRNRNKVDREFVFREICGAGLYVKLPAKPLLRLMKFLASQVLQGHVNGCCVRI